MIIYKFSASTVRSVNLGNFRTDSDFPELITADMAISTDGRWLVAGGDTKGLLQVVDLQTRQVVAVYEPGEEGEFLITLRFNKDGNKLAIGTNGSVSILNVEIALKQDKSPIQLETRWKKVENLTSSVAFSPDGKILASSRQRYTDDDPTLYLWDVDTGTKITTLKGHPRNTVTLSFNVDGTLLASSGSDEFVRFWDMETYTQVASLSHPQTQVEHLAFNPQGTLLAIQELETHTIRLWGVPAN